MYFFKLSGLKQKFIKDTFMSVNNMVKNNVADVILLFICYISFFFNFLLLIA